MSYDELCLGAATYNELRLGVNNYLPRATAPVARRPPSEGPREMHQAAVGCAWGGGDAPRVTTPAPHCPTPQRATTSYPGTHEVASGRGDLPRATTSCAWERRPTTSYGARRPLIAGE